MLASPGSLLRMRRRRLIGTSSLPIKLFWSSLTSVDNSTARKAKPFTCQRRREKTMKAMWNGVPVVIRAIIVGLLIGMIAANIWPIFLLKLGMPIAAAAELCFLL